MPSRILRSANTPSASTLHSTYEGGPIINEPYAGSDGSPTPTKNRNGTKSSLASPLPVPTIDTDDKLVLPDTLGPQSQLNHKASIISTVSASWSILSESDASIMESAEEQAGAGGGSVRGWKSAGNGEALLDFGPSGESWVYSIGNFVRSQLGISIRADCIGDRPDFSTRSSSQSRSTGSRNSLFALASSITRSGSRHLRTRPSAAPSTYSTVITATATGSMADGPTTPTKGGQAEEMVETATAPSPASTIGIPRRHSKITLLERPSTLRLCSPAPQTPGRVSFGTVAPSDPSGMDNGEEQLPFVTSAQKLRAVKMKERRSMTPGRYASGNKTSAPGSNSKEGKKKGSLTPSMKARIMGRKSMPAAVHFAPLVPPAPGGFTLGSHTQPLVQHTPDAERTAPFMAASIYPPIPVPHGSITPTSAPMTTTLFRPDSDTPPVPPVPAMPMPGTWFTSASSSDHLKSLEGLGSTPSINSPPNAASAFAFGTESPGVSSAQFTSAAQAILDQMNAKLPEGQRIGEELLKGKNAQAGKQGQAGTGTGAERKTSGGWGLSAKGKDRFAAAHEREFSK